MIEEHGQSEVVVAIQASLPSRVILRLSGTFKIIDCVCMRTLRLSVRESISKSNDM